MKSSAKNIELTTFDDLFTAGNPPGEAGGAIREIALTDLFPFKGHPFKVLDDQAMEEMVESVREHGILVPGIVRPREEGGYELIAGHRRRHACELAGNTTMPVIVRELDDEEATLFMVDSNLQRENLLPSEKAWAYKMKLDAIRRRAGRPGKGNSGQVVQNLKGKASVEIVAENAGENYKQVQRFIRLTELLPRLLQMVDDKKLPFNPAVELSYLTREEQEMLLALMEKLAAVPSLEQAKRLKKYSREGKLGADVMDAILTEERPVPVQVTLKNDRLKKYFPQSYTQKQMEQVIFSLLEAWKTKQE
ncbi:ParB/RepB/Spo0J family partition protein [Otoolea muris]|uniref:ParB/RepB/Spo0J family partition protein n=1 Tax=Otoolea muris TaxID=2941515 RepID=UPI00203E500D|nr:ParB/RepB/Spo0J family partition protein [Otoolea muris]